jgi:mono/diheme cytochrome c family protein
MWPKRLAFAVLATAGLVGAAAAAERHNVGRPITPEELAGWDIDVRPDGAGLPPGKGNVKDGQQVYANTCAVCHGDKGEGRRVEGAVGGFDRLVGGRGTLDKPTPVLTVGSFWPYATTLFDYVRRAMPFHAPQSLTNDEVYAVSAYVLHMNGILPEDAVLDAKTLPQVKMPNRDGFIGEDPRPDVKSKP